MPFGFPHSTVISEWMFILNMTNLNQKPNIKTALSAWSKRS